VNCISPAPVTNAEFIRALAHTLHRPALAPAPAFALRLALGEMADAALLSSCRAVPEKLLASGFRFRFPEIGPALAHVLAG
jgi:NAD dependent epimerase/dehydratase family enzyme